LRDLPHFPVVLVLVLEVNRVECGFGGPSYTRPQKDFPGLPAQKLEDEDENEDEEEVEFPLLP
jgi:hypothetical protein